MSDNYHVAYICQCNNLYQQQKEWEKGKLCRKITAEKNCRKEKKKEKNNCRHNTYCLAKKKISKVLSSTFYSENNNFGPNQLHHI